MTTTVNTRTDTRPDPTTETRETVNPDTATVSPSPAPRPRTRMPIVGSRGGPSVRPAAAAHLSDADVERLGQELDALRDRIIASRGAKDAAYIRRVIKVQRTLELAGRATLLFSRKRSAFIAGTAMLSVAKILENMEIGHNVLHGQWDWMRDPDIHSTTWEWDFVTPAAAWKHTHNDLHHTWTNVIGKDKDVGYSTLRMSENQPWQPHNILNPVINLVLAPFFEWGIAIYDLELEAWQEGEKSTEAVKGDLKSLGRKILRQATKDYVATPGAAALFGSGKEALIGTFVANAIRNVWAHSVIFCGHFPDGVDVFTEEMIEGETRGDWYIRQMLGSGNISGQQAHAPHDRQPQPPDRAPLLPGPPEQPLRRGRRRGARDLPPLRPALHDGSAAAPGLPGLGQGLPPRPAPEGQATAQAGAQPDPSVGPPVVSPPHGGAWALTARRSGPACEPPPSSTSTGR